MNGTVAEKMGRDIYCGGCDAVHGSFKLSIYLRGSLYRFSRWNSWSLFPYWNERDQQILFTTKAWRPKGRNNEDTTRLRWTE